MLGKGLESLIPPQKGNQNGNQSGQPPQQGGQPAQPFTQPELPAEQPRPELPPREPQVSLPASQKFNEKPIAEKPAVEKPTPQRDGLTASGSVYQIEIEKIKANPDQPRRNFEQAALQELASSIREFGILQPLVVSKVERETPTGITVEYQIIAGERRYMAAKMLGLPSVPAIIRNVHLEREKLELAVIENIQRENLNPIETARAFARLQEEFRMTQREIAAKLGKSREVVANTMRLLDLPEYIRISVEKGEISESHARLLLGIDDPGAQKRLFEDIITNKLTTRAAKERVQNPDGPRRGRPPLTEENISPDVRMLQDELSSSLGAPVEIRKGANTGRITITFYSEEELENILRKLKQERGGM
jgi:ParB family chromosome partitioning protein